MELSKDNVLKLICFRNCLQILCLMLFCEKSHSQLTVECTGNRNFVAYARVLEDYNYNVSTKAVAFDTRGSLYGCGLEENENDGSFN